MRTEAPLGSKRWNRALDAGVPWYNRLVEALVEALMADGVPPFTEAMAPVEQYTRLVALKGAGDPRFWNDPIAQQTLARLEQRFGQQAPTPFTASEYVL